MLEQLGMNAVGAAVDNTIGLIAGGVQARRQMKNQRKLMAEQLAFDKLKMEEQRKIQMQMWRDTNYAAQVEELKKAGLSIGLMYGKGGAGGTTTGAGATGVSAPSAPTGMGLQGGSQLAAQVANIELTKAQTENVKADTERKLGVDKEKVEAETNSLIQGISNQKAQEKLIKAEAGIKEIQLEVDQWSTEQYKEIVNVNLWRAINAWEKEVAEKTITQETADEAITIMEQKAIGSKLENELIKGKTGLPICIMI